MDWAIKNKSHLRVILQNRNLQINLVVEKICNIVFDMLININTILCRRYQRSMKHHWNERLDRRYFNVGQPFMFYVSYMKVVSRIFSLYRLNLELSYYTCCTYSLNELNRNDFGFYSWQIRSRTFFTQNTLTQNTQRKKNQYSIKGIQCHPWTPMHLIHDKKIALELQTKMNANFWILNWRFV